MRIFRLKASTPVTSFTSYYKSNRLNVSAPPYVDKIGNMSPNHEFSFCIEYLAISRWINCHFLLTYLVALVSICGHQGHWTILISITVDVWQDIATCIMPLIYHNQAYHCGWFAWHTAELQAVIIARQELASYQPQFHSVQTNRS